MLGGLEYRACIVRVYPTTIVKVSCITVCALGYIPFPFFHFEPKHAQDLCDELYSPISSKIKYHQVVCRPAVLPDNSPLSQTLMFLPYLFLVPRVTTSVKPPSQETAGYSRRENPQLCRQIQNSNRHSVAQTLGTSLVLESISRCQLIANLSDLKVCGKISAYFLRTTALE